MKSLQLILSLLATGGAVAADVSAAPPMRDAASHDDLVRVLRQSEQEDPMRRLPAAKGDDPSLVNQPKDLVSESDILCFGGAATLVPKRAVMHVPKNLAERLKFLPGSKIQTWADFYLQNRGWIQTVEVTRAQAEGNLALADDIRERVGKSANLVVATYQGGPISVLPLKVPENAKPNPTPGAKPGATPGAAPAKPGAPSPAQAGPSVPAPSKSSTTKPS